MQTPHMAQLLLSEMPSNPGKLSTPYFQGRMMWWPVPESVFTVCSALLFF
jgi:hypothetical protein